MIEKEGDFMNKRYFLKKLFFVFNVSVLLFLMSTKPGYCDIKYPDGFDGAKWGMKREEVLNVINTEGKEIIRNIERGNGNDYIRINGYIFGEETRISYNFRDSELHDIRIDPIKVIVKGNSVSNQYETLRLTLTEVLGEPSVTHLNQNKDECHARWDYPDREPAVEITTSWVLSNEVEHPLGTTAWETKIEMYVPLKKQTKNVYESFESVELNSATQPVSLPSLN